MDADFYYKLPPPIQYAILVGVVIFVVYFGLNKVNKFLRIGSDSPQPRENDPYQYVVSTCDRMERAMDSHFERIERILSDINKDTIETRRAVSNLPRRRGQ